MKIIYFRTSNPKYGFTKDIESSLKKYGKVESIDDMNFDIKELVEKAKKADLFFFHHCGVYTDNELNFSVSLERARQILSAIKCKKVCWFPDKGWFLNNTILEEIIPLTDKVFLNDATWARRHKYDNVFPLHMGVGTTLRGKERKEYKCQIAFYGDVLGFRKPYIDMLKKKWGSNFKVYNNLYGQDLADLIASAKVVFVPIFPNDDFYWDNRIYEILGHGGLAVYPRLMGLGEEGIISGKHYVGYKRAHELVQMIKDVIIDTGMRERIRLEGMEIAKKFSYKKRLKELFSKI
jgi:hypothetical protein